MIRPEDCSVSTNATNRFIKFLQRPQASHSIEYVSWYRNISFFSPKFGCSSSTAALSSRDCRRSGSIVTLYAIAPKHYFQWSLNRLWTAYEVSKKARIQGLAEQDINSLIAETFEEFQQGVKIMADLVVAIWKRPIL